MAIETWKLKTEEDCDAELVKAQTAQAILLADFELKVLALAKYMEIYKGSLAPELLDKIKDQNRELQSFLGWRGWTSPLEDAIRDIELIREQRQRILKRTS